MVKNSQLSTLVELFQDFGRRGAVRVEGYEQSIPYSIPASFSDRAAEIEAHPRVPHQVYDSSPVNCRPNMKKCLQQKHNTTVLIADKKETEPSIGN